MNIVPFESASLPAYLQNVDVAALNSDLTAHVGGGFPVISIKGKVFALVRDGERRILPNPKDPESPATSIDVVILKANKNLSKVYYAKGYDPQAESQKPDCYSNNGVAPEPDSQAIQSKQCATCPHNQWGSKITDAGKKGKACQDSVRLAVAAGGSITEPMLLRVPAASIKALGEYGLMLQKQRKVAYTMVLTKIGFDPAAESPKLTFKPIGLLDQAGYREVQEALELPVLENILGASAVELEAVEHTAAPAPEPKRAAARPAVVHNPDDDADAGSDEAVAAATVKAVVSKAKQVTTEEVEAAVAFATDKPKAAATKAAPKAKPAPAAEEPTDFDLDGIDFDD